MEHPSYVSYKTSKRLFAKLLRSKEHEYRQCKYESLHNDFEIDTKHIWKFLRSGKDNQSVHSINHEDNIYSSPDELRIFWRNHFSSLLNEHTQSSMYDDDHMNFITSEVDTMMNNFSKDDDNTGVLLDEFSVSEISKICKAMPNGKAPGYDLISYESMKHGGNELYRHLSILYNAIVKYVHIPTCMKYNIIVPIHKGKKKPKDDPNSYRGISLAPIINKIMEKIIFTRLKPWLEDHDFPPALQHTGRSGCSSVTCSYMVQDVIQHHVESKGKVFSCFLDIKQAFDVIWWKGLLYKLAKIGIQGKLWWIFRNWLIGSQCGVLLNGELSDSFEITRSIKQGGLLSMFYFTVAYHDIHEFANRGGDGLIYHDIDVSSPTLADDTLLLANTVNGLQRMMDYAHQYGKLWRLTYSVAKTKCMTFGETKRSNDVNRHRRRWKLGSDIIEEVNHFTYLGTVLCAFLSSKQRTRDVCRKGYALLGSLSSTGFNSTDMSPVICSSVWFRACLPSLLYSCETWGKISQQEYSDMEKVHKTVLKYIQGLHIRTHDEITRGLLGWFTIKGYIDKAKLSLFRQLAVTPPTSLVKMIFRRQLDDVLLFNKGIGSITYDLISTLREYQLAEYIVDYVTDDSIPCKLAWKSLICDSLGSIEQQKWSRGLSLKTANRFHRIQPQLQTNVIYEIMGRNIQLRSSLQILIKVLSVPENFYLPMLCELCNTTVTDSVEHLFMRCENLVDERNELWDRLLDTFGVSAEVDLFNRDDDDILEILLGKTWTFINREDPAAMDNFFIQVSQTFTQFIKSIRMDNGCQKDSIMHHLRVMKIVA